MILIMANAQYVAKTDKYKITVKVSFHMSNNLEFWLNDVFLQRANICVPITLCTNKKLKTYKCYFKKMLIPIVLSTK